MSVRTETLQLRVVIDGSPARRELAQLDQEYAKINSDLRQMKKGTEEWAAATSRLKEIGVRQAELRKEIGLTGLTAKQLQDELRRLQVAFRNLTPNTQHWAETGAQIEVVKQRLHEINNVNARAQAAWNAHQGAMKLNMMTMEQLEMESRRLSAALRSIDPNTRQFVQLRRELMAVDERMRVLQTGLSPFGRAWQGVRTQIAGAFGVMGTFLAGGAIIEGFRAMVRGAAELSDAQADVRRTTGMTKREVDDLTQKLSQFTTRTTRSELLALAADAGKLGIQGTKDVLQFVRAGDQIRVALGEDLGDDAIKAIGKLNQTFKVGQATGKNLEQQMLSTGSAINELGQKSTAQESFLVDYTTRMAGVNTQADINIQSTLGYAAALDQLGQRSETSSTALAQFTLKAFSNTATYAKIAGMEVGEFTKLLNRDANEALLRTLEGLNGNNAGLQHMTTLFADMEQEGARAVGVLASLASNTKMVREQQAIANNAFAAGTSITNEFTTKNRTLAANLEIIGKKLHGLFVNSSVVKGINSMAQGIADWLKQPVDAELQRQRQSANQLAFEIMNLVEGDAKRAEKIRELKKEYPQFTQMLDAEKATNHEIAASLDRINKAYVMKILLVKAQDEIQAIGDRQAEAIEAEGDALDLMTQRRLKAEEKMSADQKRRFAENYERIMNQFKIMDTMDASTMQKRMKFNTEMQKYGMGATLFDDLHKVHQARVAHEKAQAETLKANEEFAQKMQRINRLAAMAGGEETVGTSDSGSDSVVVESEDSKALEKAREEMERLRDELDRQRREMELEAMDADSREVARIDDKYAALRERILANENHTHQDLLELDELHEQERANKLAELGNARLAKAEEARQKAIADHQKGADELYEEGQTPEDLEIVRALKHMDDLLAILEDGSEEEKQLVERTEKEIAGIRERYDKEERQKSRQAIAQKINDYAQLADSLGNVMGGIQAIMEANADADNERTEKENKRIRDAAMVQIAIKAAVAIASGVASAMTLPFPGNLVAVATTVGTVLSLIAQAKQLMNSANSSTSSNTVEGPAPSINQVPLGEKGGIFEGPSHSEGGLKVVNPKTGRIEAEVEGGEPWMVLSKAFRRNNPGLVKRLLKASATGEKLANGGIFTPAPAFNYSAASQAINTLQLAQGGMLQPGRSRDAATITGDATDQPDRTQMAVLQELRALRQAFALFPREFVGKIGLGDLEKKQEVRDRLLDLVTARKVTTKSRVDRAA